MSLYACPDPDRECASPFLFPFPVPLFSRSPFFSFIPVFPSFLLSPFFLFFLFHLFSFFFLFSFFLFPSSLLPFFLFPFLLFPLLFSPSIYLPLFFPFFFCSKPHLLSTMTVYILTQHAFRPTVLTICSQSFTDAQAPQRLKKTIHGIMQHIVIIFHHGSVTWFTLAAW